MGYLATVVFVCGMLVEYTNPSNLVGTSTLAFFADIAGACGRPIFFSCRMYIVIYLALCYTSILRLQTQLNCYYSH